MPVSQQLQQAAQRYLQGALGEAGADPRRIYRRTSYTRPIGDSRDKIRGGIARDYQRWKFHREQGDPTYEPTFGLTILIMEHTVGGQTVLDAEVHDLDNGASMTLRQPVRKKWGRWKAEGPTQTLAEAEPLPFQVREPATFIDLAHIDLDERRRLIDSVPQAGIPTLPDQAGFWINVFDQNRLPTVPGWHT